MGSPACEFAVCMFVSVRERDRDRETRYRELADGCR